MINIDKTILPNGITIVTETLPYVDCFYIGAHFDVGSKDEAHGEEGISHFMEHMMFQGTKTRSQLDISNELDFLGVESNALTSNFTTSYYLGGQPKQLQKLTELLSDLLLNSVFDEEKFEKEKQVIIEEAKRQEDYPEGNVHTLFREFIWQHPIGRRVIGDMKVVGDMTRDMMLDYRDRMYKPNALIISAAGNIQHEDIVYEVSKCFGEMRGERPVADSCLVDFNYITKHINKDIEQMHFCIGGDYYNTDQRVKRWDFDVLQVILGGGLSSRLWQEIRENRGLAYSVGMYALHNPNGGYYSVFGGVDPTNIDETLEVIKTEITKIKTDGITDRELEQAKNLILGDRARSGQTMYSRMARNASYENMYQSKYNDDDFIKQIKLTTKEDIAQICNDIFTGQYATVTLGDKNVA